MRFSLFTIVKREFYFVSLHKRQEKKKLYDHKRKSKTAGKQSGKAKKSKCYTTEKAAKLRCFSARFDGMPFLRVSVRL